MSGCSVPVGPSGHQQSATEFVASAVEVLQLFVALPERSTPAVELLCLLLALGAPMVELLCLMLPQFPMALKMLALRSTALLEPLLEPLLELLL